MDAFLNDAPCAFLTFTEKGIITAVNRTCCHWLEYDAAALCGKRFDSLLSIAGRIFFQTHFFPLLTLQGKAEEIFMTLFTKSRTELPVLVNAGWRAADGAGSFHCVMMPVHQRKKYEAELLQARKTAEATISKNEQLRMATEALEANRIDLDKRVTQLSILHENLAKFSRVISHDMQEPVRKIEVFANIILRESEAALSGPIRHAADRIMASSQRMRKLITCIEEYVNIDIAGTVPERCDLISIIEAAKEQVTAAVAVPVVLSMQELPELNGHREQLKLLFYHLILNAAQFRGAGVPAVRITIEADTIQQNSFRSTADKYRYVDVMRIIVSDDGQGFEPEYAEYIFQLFKTAHTKSEGLGFGLALCRKIMDNHYGSITATSEPGKGASFTLLFPLFE